jgi:hypothetical protein
MGITNYEFLELDSYFYEFYLILYGFYKVVKLLFCYFTRLNLLFYLSSNKFQRLDKV